MTLVVPSPHQNFSTLCPRFRGAVAVPHKSWRFKALSDTAAVIGNCVITLKIINNNKILWGSAKASAQ